VQVAALSCSSAEQSLAHPKDEVAAERGSGGTSPSDSGIDLDSGAGSPGIGPTCATAELAATLKPLDIYIMLDRSGSMTEFGDRWTPVTSAIKAFVNSPRSLGLGVGLQYFPLGVTSEEKCDVAAYASPDVPIAILPGNAGPLGESIDAHYFTQAECCDEPEHSGTPTRPAVEGALQYLRTWLSSQEDRVAVLLLATDGQPTKVCDNNGVPAVVSAIAAGASGSPPVYTYVIGIGVEENLAQMAEAGGTASPPFIVDGAGGEKTEQEFLSALSLIRGKKLSCDVAIPDGAGSDPWLINVQYRAEGVGDPATLLYVSSAADCDPAISGWYYDDPEAPTRVILCPETCTAVRSDARAKLEVVVGCRTVVR
jgi:hypothetical protein